MNYAPANNAGTSCFGGIQENTGLPFSIFGDIFLKYVYPTSNYSISYPC